MTDPAPGVDHSHGFRSLKTIDSTRLPLATRPFARFVNLNLAPDDEMYEGVDDHYVLCGASALNLILCAIDAALTAPRAILDFGAGAGRVTRWLRAAFPSAHIGACDLRAPDMAFCHDQFHAQTWISGIDIAALKAPNSYDLIWVSSVLTHLSAQNCGRLIDKLLSWTNPGGLLVMSTHGRTALLPENHEEGYTLDAEAWSDVQAQYAALGFGYADYTGQPGYGVSLTKLSWWGALIEAMPNARAILLSEGLLGNHQDVVAIQKTPMAERAQDAATTAEQIAVDLASAKRKSLASRGSWFQR
jgi:2-polyprenyl-3-methyl-5-hydroxy-6-metoxy-1,4-benzoquinol methylase